MTLTVVIGLAACTWAFRGAGSVLPQVPEALARRTTGLAPALLAGLVVTELTGATGVPRLDAKAAGVAAAALLAARRAPLAVCVVAGAGVAAALRLLG